MMRRRQFITLLGAAATAWPLAARAQQPRMPVIGLLYPQSQGGAEFVLRSLRQGLKDQGYVEGYNLSIKYALAQNQIDRLPAIMPDRSSTGAKPTGCVWRALTSR